MRRLPSLILCAALLLTGGELPAQTYSHAPFEEPTFQQVRRKRKTPPPPPIAFLVVREIPLPGPLPPGDIVLRDDTVLIAVAGGVARIDLSSPSEAEVSLEEGEGPGKVDIAWVHGGPKGNFRYRTHPEGMLVAEKRGYGWNREWKRRWRLRSPGGTPSPPLTDGGRVFYGCTDNRIYAVRAKNGHRLWAHDAEERVTRPLALWTGTVDTAEKFGLLLAIPDRGTSLIALDPFDGKRLATHRLRKDGESMVSSPVVTFDGRILAAVQKYKPSDAGLVVLQVVPAERLAPPGEDASGQEADEVSDEGDR